MQSFIFAAVKPAPSSGAGLGQVYEGTGVCLKRLERGVKSSATGPNKSGTNARTEGVLRSLLTQRLQRLEGEEQTLLPVRSRIIPT